MEPAMWVFGSWSAELTTWQGRCLHNNVCISNDDNYVVVVMSNNSGRSTIERYGDVYDDVPLVQRRDRTGARNASWTWRRLEREVRRSTVVAVAIVEVVCVVVVASVLAQTEVWNRCHLSSWHCTAHTQNVLTYPIQCSSLSFGTWLFSSLLPVLCLREMCKWHWRLYHNAVSTKWHVDNSCLNTASTNLSLPFTSHPVSAAFNPIPTLSPHHWWSGVVAVRWSLSTTGPVSCGMGDRVWVQFHVSEIYLGM